MILRTGHVGLPRSLPFIFRWAFLSVLVWLAVLPVAAAAQVEAADTIPGPFDAGRMWTFEHAPLAYFSETYGFDADREWLERARLPALRIPGCSASFVSPAGLVVTNHHCARGAIVSVAREGETLLDDGFYAATLDEERRIPDYHADQLIGIEDVSDEVLAAEDTAGAAGESRDAARAAAVARIEERLGDAWSDRAEGFEVRVEVVALYHGGRYSAYVFRRFTDLRLVAAAELALGFFGGDPDNFTYPRYALDFTFYRVYGPDGEPYRPGAWFTWGGGVEEGDAVFVIGNPGPTNRLNTVAQLRYQRDLYVPVRKRFFETRLEALRAQIARDPAEAERLGLRNTAFSLSNSLKAYTGRLEALRDPVIMARKRVAEEALLDSLASRPRLRELYGGAVGAMAGVQEERMELAGPEGAFFALGSSLGSRTLARALSGAMLRQAGSRGASDADLDDRRRMLLEADDHPAPLERELLALRLEDLRRWLGEDDPLVGRILADRSAEAVADALLASSVFARRDRLAEALEGPGIPGDDPALALVEELLPRVAEYQRMAGALGGRERELAADLGRARFEVYGAAMAPDATFSPRITDGVVRGYEYNGTLAPPYTTLFGLYDHYHGHGGSPDWDLPDRWVPPPPGLDLSTPLNFVSTADTYGGNSGSPAVTPELELVGLNFDRNIEGLSRDFIFLPDRGRNVMVDVRAILESLDHVYDADRIVVELTTGEMVPSEAAADALR